MPGVKKYDAIVIGGGHNGLTAAAYLAKAGKKVLVLERRYVLGGAAVTEEIFPGFKFSVCSYVVSLMKPNVMRELMLPKFGLELLPLESTFTPLDNDYLIRTADADETYREIARHSLRDAEAYMRFGPAMGQIGMAVRPILETIAPNAIRPSLSDLSKTKKLLDHFKTLSSEQFEYLTKLMTMSSADFLDEWFEFEPLKASMSAQPTLSREAVIAQSVQAGLAGNMDLINAIPDKPTRGMAKATLVQVKRKGGQLPEHLVKALSETPSVQTTEKKSADTSGGFGSQEEQIHYLVNLALDGLPDFTCLPGEGHHLRGAISISPSYDHLERAYDDAKYGNFSQEPYMDIILPSVLDPEMAPPGKHVMSCFVQYAPYDIKGGWNDQKREAFGDAVVNTIARFAPNIKDIILHRQVLTPADIESTFGLTEGNIFHGELTLQQLFAMRPAVQWADYTTPIRNYYQCGSGTHPGGGITGSPGEMAAKKILGVWK